MSQIEDIKTVYQGWGRLLLAQVRLADGTLISREIEDHGVAAVVLPYDRQRRVAILVRQLRTPVLHSGGPAELLEAPAGRIESTSPEECARREGMEEAGLRIGELVPVSTLWTMPGISTERLHLFLAPVTAADRVASGGGLADEHENITVVEMPLKLLLQQLDSGALDDMKTAFLVQALLRREPELFA
ncbi:NUDIX domain-containing protein [Chelatococcus reniformis]|uniref:ADP-ribose pyrophosphatase n=1 Tax=Chelatococcus reniformis TaxID=1494448 RepID=A0A916U0Y4_9HYPH|nr:NUDIX hydrolase [Chelatococcus reniformis]GGC55335.1 ADP-ribose pyrophosphatase [Chelatococcus reniformis]